MTWVAISCSFFEGKDSRYEIVSKMSAYDVDLFLTPEGSVLRLILLFRDSSILGAIGAIGARTSDYLLSDTM